MPRPRLGTAACGDFGTPGPDLAEPNGVEGLGGHRNAPGSSLYFATSSSAFSNAAAASLGVQPLASVFSSSAAMRRLTSGSSLALGFSSWSWSCLRRRDAAGPCCRGCPHPRAGPEGKIFRARWRGRGPCRSRSPGTILSRLLMDWNTQRSACWKNWCPQAPPQCHPPACVLRTLSR